MDKILLLKTCIYINLSIIGLFISSFFVFDHYNSHYFNFGWSNEFVFMSIPIDNPFKYFTFCGFIIVMNISEIFIDYIASPIIQFTTYNPYKNEICDFSRFELELYSNTIFFIQSSKRLIQVFIVLSQLDIAIISLLSSQVSVYLAIKYLLQYKTFIGDNRIFTTTHSYQNPQYVTINTNQYDI